MQAWHINEREYTEEYYTRTRKKGLKGERMAIQQLNKVLLARKRPYHILHNVRVPRCGIEDTQYYELDALIVMADTVVVVEVKNIGGIFEGNSMSETWLQTYRDGQTNENVTRHIPNPEQQLKQRIDAVQSLLDHWGYRMKARGLLIMSKTADTTRVRKGHQGLIYYDRLQAIGHTSTRQPYDKQKKRINGVKPLHLSREQQAKLKMRFVDLQSHFAKEKGVNQRYYQIDTLLRNRDIH